MTTIPFRKIIFPTDFSAASEAMAPQARRMTELCGAELTVLHSFNVMPGYAAPGYPDATGQYMNISVSYVSWMAELREQSQERLRAFAREHFAGVDWRALMEDGDPASAIHIASEREGADLIMMPTSGMGTFRRFLLGSVTAKVLHDVKCAVFTDAHELAAERKASAEYGTVLCAVELNREAEAVLKAAGAFARFRGAKLTVVHAESPGRLGDTPADLDITAMLREIGVEARFRILAGGVAAGIRRAAAEEGADLVVVGRGRDRGAISRMWSDLYEIIRESPCPVLSV